ncbi:unnamed protein product [Cladocopium goreaui]|uniref:Uncharacterized protein n=1 Tax=Cladocopium goreaui TaxID=2562237 RepID=A0A9P1BJK9_9DINO|nr:unnamed protein product [Cladocopium goreaui]
MIGVNDAPRYNPNLVTMVDALMEAPMLMLEVPKVFYQARYSDFAIWLLRERGLMVLALYRSAEASQSAHTGGFLDMATPTHDFVYTCPPGTKTLLCGTQGKLHACPQRSRGSTGPASWCEEIVRMVPSATLSLTLSQVEHYPSKGCGQIDDLTAETICLRRLPVESALISVAPGALDAGQGGGREVLTGTLKNFGISESKSHFGEANGLSEHEETKGFGITKWQKSLEQVTSKFLEKKKGPTSPRPGPAPLFLLYQNTAPSQGAVEVIIPDKPILSLIHSQHQPEKAAADRREQIHKEQVKSDRVIVTASGGADTVPTEVGTSGMRARMKKAMEHVYGNDLTASG